MKELSILQESKNVYIEQTYRIHGGPGWEFGPVLWSPAYGRDGRDSWRIMREVVPGDVIIHSLRGEHGHSRTFDGISKVKSPYQEVFVSPPLADRWVCDKYYRIELESYKPFNQSLSVSDFLHEYHYQLTQLNQTNSFYARDGRCAQKYLAPIPPSVLELLMDHFRRHNILFEDNNLSMGGEESLPSRETCVVTRVLRDSEIIKQLKIEYDNRCQICNQKIQLPGGKYYSEGHHIRQLGFAHQGPDVKGNIIILCPFHHTEFDYGAIGIKNNKIIHIDKNNKYHNQSLAYSREDLEETYLQYHMEHIFGKTK